MKTLSAALTLLLTFTIAGQAQDNKQKLKLEDIWNSRQFLAKGLPEVRSMNNGVHYTSLDGDSLGQYIVRYEYKTGKAKDTLFNSAKYRYQGNQLVVSHYTFSADESRILLETDAEPIYRHSTKASNYVFLLADKSLKQVSGNGKQMYAEFSPDGKKVAFVRDNNLYLSDPGAGTEVMVTRDGKKNEIINGATDWVYEEEFSFDQAYQWSPDGNHIAYYRFDESQVKEFNLTYYGTLYPKEEKYKYPKAGEENSKVEIFIYDTRTSRSVKADANKESDQYIPRIKWTAENGKLCIMRMNRLQNKVELLSCDAATGSCLTFFTEENPAYLEVNDDLTFMADKKSFIWNSPADGYNHLYLYDMQGNKISQITRGKFDVTEFYGYNASSGEYFYQAAAVHPMGKEVYATNGKGKTRLLSPSSGTSSASFSNNFRFYFITHSSFGNPFKVTLHDHKAQVVRVIEDNKNTVNNLAKYELSKGEFFKFTTSEGVELNGWMIKPANFNPSKKYPVIQYMYSGPGSQTVTDSWGGSNYMWFQMLAQQGYIIVSVDNRGTGCRGEAFMKCTYKQLGKLETVDQIEVAKWLGKQSYVDASRIGAWGWSFGGYMTSLLMTKGADFFKAAVAVAPVTNWRYYDTIYTERYLQTPQMNAQGYDDNSPVNYAGLMKGKFLLIHGSTDDNVHLQNTMEFITALTKEKKQFDTFIYPNKAHGIGGVRLHLYTMMTDFFLENL